MRNYHILQPFKVFKYPTDNSEIDYNLIDIIDDYVDLITIEVSQVITIGDEETIISIH